MTSLIVAAWLAQAPAAPAKEPPKAAERSSEERTLGARSYRFHRAKETKNAPPLVLVFHGLCSNGRQTELMTGLDEVADEQGFAVAYPDGERRMWRYQERSPDVEFVAALI